MMMQNGLVDTAAAKIDRSIFVDDAIYRAELERIFARMWLFVGHETQIPKPGDFFTSRMGAESVILCRDREHKIHVFLNTAVREETADALDRAWEPQPFANPYPCPQ